MSPGGRDEVLVAKYGKGWRWWPSPESRKRGSARWTAPPVELWHPASSIEAATATFQASQVAVTQWIPRR